MSSETGKALRFFLKPRRLLSFSLRSAVSCPWQVENGRPLEDPAGNEGDDENAREPDQTEHPAPLPLSCVCQKHEAGSHEDLHHSLFFCIIKNDINTSRNGGNWPWLNFFFLNTGRATRFFTIYCKQVIYSSLFSIIYNLLNENSM